MAQHINPGAIYAAMYSEHEHILFCVFPIRACAPKWKHAKQFSGSSCLQINGMRKSAAGL
jgi:hypothetical protein